MKSIDQINKDYHLFIDIQIKKYLRLTGKKAFDKDAESKLVLDEIVKVYNEKVASEHLKLDNLNPIAKNKWFNDIEIDFKGIITKMDEFDEEFVIQFGEVSKQFDKIFDYLPEDSMQVVIFSGPALDAYGLSFERFEALLQGENATDFERDLIEWAFEVTLNVMDAYFSNSINKKHKSLSEAVILSEEYLNPIESEDVVKSIFNNISDAFNIPVKKVTSPAKRKKKK
jgi:transposase